MTALPTARALAYALRTRGGERATLVGLALSGSAVHMTTTSLFSGADEIGHFDYAWELWHGSLPEFWRGTVFDPPLGNDIPVQWVYQHPPLFYALIAPLVGPLSDAGHVLAAGYAARIANALIGGLLVLCVIWAVEQAFPTRPRWAIASGFVAASAAWVHISSGEIYNDSLAAVWAALAVGITCRMLRRGPSLPRWTAFILVSSAALLTRLPTLAVVGLCCAVLTLDDLLRAGAHPATTRLRSLAGSLSTVVAILATSGWFYARNRRLSGSITGGQTDFALNDLGRTPRSLPAVVVDRGTWAQLYGVFSFANSPTAVSVGLLMAIPLAASGALAVRALCRRTRGEAPWPSRPTTVVVITLAALGLGVTAMQLNYGAGGGFLIPRYLFPALVALALAVAIPLVAGQHRWPPALIAWTVVNDGLLLWSLRTLSGPPIAGQYPTFAAGAYVFVAAFVVLSGVAIWLFAQPRLTPAAA